MGFSDLLISQGAESLFDMIDHIEIAVIKGFFYILSFAIFLGLVIWLVFGFFVGHWLRSTIIIGLYIFVEVCNFVGGGHSGG